MRGLRWFVLLLACVFASGAAAEYPDHPIRLVVPQAAGSATDTVARILGAELAKELGQTIVIDNRAGGALTIGIDIVAKAAPDGYTIGMGPIGALAITRHMVAKLPYDIERDLQPIALATRGHLLLAVTPKMEINSVQELIDYAKKNPGKLLNASSSNGSPGHVGGELFKFMTGTEIAEAGVPGYEAGTWSGVIGPAGVPRPILDKLNAAINKSINSTAFKERFAAIGDEPAGGTPEEFADTIRKDSAKWADVIRRSGARLD